jgi:hypothetical protein
MIQQPIHVLAEQILATVLPGSPAEFGKLIADEAEKWAKVISPYYSAH